MEVMQKEENFKGWSRWALFVSYGGQNDCVWRTNRRKTQVRFLTDNVTAESCCNKEDEFDLALGIKIAYLRCCNKVLEKNKAEHEAKLKAINEKICNNETTLKKMINSIEG